LPSASNSACAPGNVSLDDKWTTDLGDILISGNQAIARALMEQARLDRRHGIKSASYISGYRGSPLGNVDSALWSVEDRLVAHNIRFVPGVNEDLAATAVRGTQQIDFMPGAKADGVFAAWYGKGPGVDRSLDALKHGNFGGAHPKGGVLVFYGDDHGGKSSTVSHHSEQAMASALIPSLYPADVGEIIEYSLLGYALSRYSGSWVGIKCANEVVEQTATVHMNMPAFATVQPPTGMLPPEGLHVRKGPFGPLREEQIVSDYRLPLVRRFVRANRIDRIVFKAAKPRLGLVTAGKSYGDTRAALALLGLDETRAKSLGISLYKVGCIWPLEPEGIREFAAGHEQLFFIEEKKSFLELQVAEILINEPSHPRLTGKKDESGAPLLSEALQLEPIGIALAIAGRLEAMGIGDAALQDARQELRRYPASENGDKVVAIRSPYFCSGCPHSRSTRIPEGSLSMTGIGCHTMVSFVRPDEALLPTHMGGEGANWIGLAPYTDTPHIFQNMGDGTYFHSGLLAIRAAIAAGVNITYKILYNDAVAMTGGQPVDGPISVAEIAHQVRHEGVQHIVIVSDNPDQYRHATDLPDDIRITHRDDLDAVQRDLREVPGCSVLIYEQTCAAEKRRRRKRSEYPDPPRRLFIAEAVCEGCGDCSAQSTCVSLIPVETEFGTKRQIDQSNCNKDFSCLNGFCPSFITVDGAEPAKRRGSYAGEDIFATLPEAPRADIGTTSFNLMIAGIGGTGVVTVGALLGMAAHMEGRAVSLFDMTGLSQKNGAVYSHVRIAHSPDALHAQKLGAGEADLLLAFDMVAGLGSEAARTIRHGRTRAVVNSDAVPTAAFQFDRNARVSGGDLAGKLSQMTGADALYSADALSLAEALLGNVLGANLFLVGIAAQRGLLPVGIAAIEQAVRLNGVAVDFNMKALNLGRLFVADRRAFDALLPAKPLAPALTFADIVERSAQHLARYQNAAYAALYRGLVSRVRAAEAGLGSETLSRAVARGYAKLLSYKDEYEVARLLSDPALHKELRLRFAGNPSLSFNLAPPVWPGKLQNGRPRKRRFPAKLTMPFLRVLARLKGLRGTPFDLFGYTAERRAERALIREYQETVEAVLQNLTPANHALAVALLDLPGDIRGFGPVKAEAMDRYQEARAKLLNTFLEATGDGAAT
jgi:indolepyruvate ferredoxin oxidoreductase